MEYNYNSGCETSAPIPSTEKDASQQRMSAASYSGGFATTSPTPNPLPIPYIFDNTDNLSVSSRNSIPSYGASASFQSNMDFDISPQVNVRDMIRRYNSAAKSYSATPNTSPRLRNSSNLLLKSKSSYLGLNKFGSQTNVKIENLLTPKKFKEKMLQRQQSLPIARSRSFSQNCLEEMNQNKVETNERLSTDSDADKMADTTEVLISDNLEIRNSQSRLRLRTNLTDNGETSDGSVPSEASYQSRTTIAKTSKGVRISIDIYFDDQEKECNNKDNYDMLCSRIETSIPHSRILSDFQQHFINLKKSQNENN